MTTANKYIHFLLGITFVISAITAIIILTQFSRPELINILENCANSHGTDVMPADSLAFAEVIRHKIWNFHITSGILLFFTFFVFTMRLKRNIHAGKRPLRYYVYTFGLLLTIMLLTGLLYLQTYVGFLENYKDIYVGIHYVLAYLIGGLVLIHIVERIKATTGGEQGDE